MTSEQAQELSADIAEPLRRACASAIAARSARADRVNLEPSEATGNDLLEALGCDLAPILAVAAINDRCDDLFLQQSGLGDGLALRHALLGFGGVMLRDSRPTLQPHVRESVLTMFRRLDYRILTEVHRLSSRTWLAIGDPLEALRHALVVEDRPLCRELLMTYQQEWLVAGHAEEIREAYALVDPDSGLSGELTRQGWEQLDSGRVTQAYSYARLANLAARPDESDLALADRSILRVQSAFLMGDLRSAAAAVPIALQAAATAGLSDVASLVSAGLVGRGLVEFDRVPTPRPDSAIHLAAQGVRQALAHFSAGNLVATQRVLRDAKTVMDGMSLPLAFAPVDVPLLMTWLTRELTPTWGVDDLQALEDLNGVLRAPLLDVECLHLRGLERLDAQDVSGVRNALLRLGEYASQAATSQDLANMARLREADLRIRLGQDAAALALVQQASPSPARDHLLVQLTARHRPSQALDQARAKRAESAWAEIRFLLISAAVAVDEHDRHQGLTAALEVAHEFGFARSVLDYLPKLRPHVLTAMSRDSRFAFFAASAGGTRAEGSTIELTARQIEIMRHFAAGMTVHDVASATGLTPGTAKAHAVQVARRLGVNSRDEAIAELRRRALI